MSTKHALEYQLAEIELDRRQLQLEERKLQLERKELEVKKRLAHLNGIDVIEDKGQTDLGTRVSSAEEQISKRNDSSSEPQVDTTSFTTTTDTLNTSVEDETYVKTEKSSELSQLDNAIRPSEEERSSPATDSSQEPVPLTQRQIRRKAMQQSDSLPVSPADQSDIVSKFLGKTNTIEPPPGNKQKRARPREEIDTDEADNPKSTSSIIAGKSGSGRARRQKRRRVLRAEKSINSQETEGLTDSEQYSLILHYTELFIKHMSTAEQRVSQRTGPQVVASKMRKLNVGTAHPDLTSLHREFATTIRGRNINQVLRFSLQAELEQFENALPHWSPKCKALQTQKERLAMIDKVVERIANKDFEIKDYEDYYDPYNEL